MKLLQQLKKILKVLSKGFKVVLFYLGELFFTVLSLGMYLVSRFYTEVEAITYFEQNRSIVESSDIKRIKKTAIIQTIPCMIVPFYFMVWILRAVGVQESRYKEINRPYSFLLVPLLIVSIVPILGAFIVLDQIGKKTKVILREHPQGKEYAGRARNPLEIGSKIIISIISFGVFYLVWLFSIVRRSTMLSSKFDLIKGRKVAFWNYLGVLFIPFYSAYWFFQQDLTITKKLKAKHQTTQEYHIIFAVLQVLGFLLLVLVMVGYGSLITGFLIGFFLQTIISLITATLMDRKLHRVHMELLPALEYGIFLREDRPTHVIRRLTPKKVIIGAFSYTWLVGMALIVLMPVLWMVSATFTVGTQLAQVPVIPKFSEWSLDNFINPEKGLFTYISSTAETVPDYVRAFLTSLSIASLNMVLVVVFSSLVGFSFSRYRFKGKKQVLLIMMGLQMFPSFMGMLALFMFYRQFGLLNNPVALTLIYVAGSIPYNTFIVRGFMRNIPKSLDEAAFIDGASNLQTLLRIIIPLAVPIMGFIAVNAFMAPWLDFILPSVIMPSKDTVAVWLFRYMDPMSSTYSPLRFMSGALVIAVPIMIVQAFMQRYLVYGLTSGAEKG